LLQKGNDVLNSKDVEEINQGQLEASLVKWFDDFNILQGLNEINLNIHVGQLLDLVLGYEKIFWKD